MMAEIELKDETFNRRLIANEFAKKSIQIK